MSAPRTAGAATLVRAALLASCAVAGMRPSEGSPGDGGSPATAPPAGERGFRVVRVVRPEEHGGRAQSFAVREDGRGVLYVGNLKGVLEFDGSSWRLIALRKGSAAFSLATGPDGRVYVGGWGELGVLAPDPIGELRYTSLVDRIPDELRPAGLVRGVHAVGGSVLFGTDSRLFLWDGHAVKVLPAGPGGAFGRSFDAGGGEVWVQAPDGLARVSPEGLVPLPEEVRLRGETVEAIVPTREGARLAVVKGKGLLVLDREGVRPAGEAAGRWLRGKEVVAAVPLPDGRVALGTRRAGVAILGPGLAVDEAVGEAEGLADGQVRGLAVARDGALWVALDAGLCRVALSSTVSVFDRRNGLSGAVAGATRIAGRLLVSSAAGLFALEPAPAGGSGRPPARFVRVAGIEQRCYGVAAAGDDLLVATQSGLLVVRGGEAQTVPGTERHSFSAIVASTGLAGAFWLGLPDGIGLLRQDHGAWSVARHPLGGTGPVRTLVEEPGSPGTLWVGTVFRGVLRVRFPNVEKPPEVTPVGPAGEAMVFSCSDGLRAVLGERGVFRVDRSAPALVLDPAFPASAGGGDFHKGAEDVHGSVWLNTSPPSFFARRGGLLVAGRRVVPEIPGTDSQLLVSLGDAVWISTEEGLFRCEASRDVPVLPPPAPLVRRVVAEPAGVLFGGTEGARPAELPDVPARTGRLRFECASLVHFRPAAFEYWLEGSETTWSRPLPSAVREYTNLWEGRYVFHARTRDPLTLVAGPEATFAFRVSPPWWRTLPALALWSLLAGALGAAVVRFRLRALKARERELVRLVAERTDELKGANERLLEAQEKIGRLLASGPRGESVPDWARSVGLEIAGAVGARAIGIWELERGDLSPLADAGVPPPSSATLETLRTGAEDGFVDTGDGSVVPVTGMTGALCGALVVQGARGAWGDTERRLVASFARQLGGAIEMSRLRQKLAAAEERRAATRRELHERGVATLQVCGRCGRCYDQTAAACADDGAELDSPQPFPFVLLGRYRFLRLLGQGGMGVVLSAMDEKLGREVAVKLIRAERWGDTLLQLRFEREAHAVARIQHPGVVELHDSGELEDGTAFLVMEKLVGCDLRLLMKSHGPGTPAQVAQLVRQGAAALKAAHGAGLLHRDIKPENVFVVDDPGGFRVKIVDFGLARPMAVEKGLTQTGTVVGTPAYMAPEQVRGAPLDTRADVYSFAAVAYEALTGSPAIVGGEPGEVFARVLGSVPPAASLLVPGIPPGIDAAFESALAKDPSRRARDIETWASSLADLLEGAEAEAGTAGWPRTPDGLAALRDSTPGGGRTRGFPGTFAGRG